jgi:ribonucleoside-triphosphate reductase
MKVEKRDGTIQPFRFDKIEAAVTKVFVNKPVQEPVPDKFIDELREYFDKLVAKQDAKDKNYALPIEEIQNIIRDFLIKKNKIKAAESFIIYRKKREDAREGKSWLKKEIFRKLKGDDVENQNANLDESSFGGRLGEANRVVTKDFALKYIVSKKSRDNHNNNEIYIHDLDSYIVGMHNCLTIPFDKLLANGFSVRQTDVRPANSINTTIWWCIGKSFGLDDGSVCKEIIS